MPTGAPPRRLLTSRLPGVSADALAGVLVPLDAPTGPGGGGFVVLTSGTLSLFSDGDAAGTAVLTFGPAPSGALGWLVRRWVIEMEGNTSSVKTRPRCEVWLGNVMVDSTTSLVDVASGDPPLIVPGGRSLEFRYSGLPIGTAFDGGPAARASIVFDVTGPG